MKYKKMYHDVADSNLDFKGVSVYVDSVNDWCGAYWDTSGPREWVKHRRKIAFQEIRKLINKRVA